jgi:hypothetical protein
VGEHAAGAAADDVRSVPAYAKATAGKRVGILRQAQNERRGQGRE